jgi:exopolyphosphatase/guanosine-5'-triphosphate,3'-diphosphate pyrophosphatase
MRLADKDQTYAAVDLGSNSFHLVVARRIHGELRYLDRIKEMVRLAGGLDSDGHLDTETRYRALECLARFGQRLRGIPDANIRALGTQTFRRMRNANAFLVVAETALGCPIDIVAGREEARLVYLGVSQGVAGATQRRLVVDIGGGSTELVVGEGLQPLELESLQVGCVSATRRYFPDGRISERRWLKARRAVLVELQELQLRYRKLGWEEAIGSSGTIRAAAVSCQQRGWCDDRLTAEALQRLAEEVLSHRHMDELDLAGFSEPRKPVFVGGLAALSAIFESLRIESMTISPYALREGALFDLLGRLEHRDPRETTVDAFMARYAVDRQQAARVSQVALQVLQQLLAPGPPPDAWNNMLRWAAGLHETGLNISHGSYQLHSGYLVAQSDMVGFSQQEQQLLAILVRRHRREISRAYARALPTRLHEPLRLLLLCLRLACVLSRTREDRALPDFRVLREGRKIRLLLAPEWAMSHPLTIADLEAERSSLRVPGWTLELQLERTDGPT